MAARVTRQRRTITHLCLPHLDHLNQQGAGPTTLELTYTAKSLLPQTIHRVTGEKTAEAKIDRCKTIFSDHCVLPPDNHQSQKQISPEIPACTYARRVMPFFLNSLAPFPTVAPYSLARGVESEPRQGASISRPWVSSPPPFLASS